MLAPCEPLFLCGRNDFAIAYQHGGTIVIERRYTQNVHSEMHRCHGVSFGVQARVPKICAGIAARITIEMAVDNYDSIHKWHEGTRLFRWHTTNEPQHNQNAESQ